MISTGYIVGNLLGTYVGLYVHINHNQEVCALSLSPESANHKETNLEQPVIQRIREQLIEYFAGKRKRFDIPYTYKGTNLQETVWQYLLSIPYSMTVSYQDIAQAINQERAFRAVGNAVARNPLAILLPCHRVVYKNGSIGYYAHKSLGEYGKTIKTKLLSLERNNA